MKKTSPHFSQNIDFRRLEHESYRLLWLGIVVAVTLHAFLALWLHNKQWAIRNYSATAAKTRAIPFDIIVRPPRMRNPYDNWRHEPKQRPRERLAKPRSEPDIRGPEKPKNELTVPLDVNIGEQELGKKAIGRDLTREGRNLLAPLEFELPEIFPELKTNRQISQHENWDDNITFGMIDSLGLTKSLLVIDPNNKENIKGFFHIPTMAYELRPTMFRGFALQNAVPGIAEAFSYFTGIHLAVDDPVSLNSSTLNEYPVLYITSAQYDVMKLNKSTSTAFGDYLRGGGFVIFDNGIPWMDYSPVEASFMNVLMESLDGDFEIQPIPPEHFIYHCFFDIHSLPDGDFEHIEPPIMSRVNMGIYGIIKKEVWATDWKGLSHDTELIALRRKMSGDKRQLWGIWHNGRLCALYSDYGFGYSWLYGTLKENHLAMVENDFGLWELSEQMKIGINFFVYALLSDQGKSRIFVNQDKNPRKTSRLSMEDKSKTF